MNFCGKKNFTKWYAKKCLPLFQLFSHFRLFPKTKIDYSRYKISILPELIINKDILMRGLLALNADYEKQIFTDTQQEKLLNIDLVNTAGLGVQIKGKNNSLLTFGLLCNNWTIFRNRKENVIYYSNSYADNFEILDLNMMVGYETNIFTDALLLRVGYKFLNYNFKYQETSEVYKWETSKDITISGGFQLLPAFLYNTNFGLGIYPSKDLTIDISLTDVLFGSSASNRDYNESFGKQPKIFETCNFSYGINIEITYAIE